MIGKYRDLIFVTSTLKGEKRSKNQDDILIIDQDRYYLFLLFDGVSSSNNSYDFIQVCKKFIIKNNLKYLTDEIRLSELLYDTHSYSIKNLQKEKGFSTCSAICILKENLSAYYFNIGDSRIYEYSNQFLEQITHDDNLPGNSNYLTKFLGSLEIIKSDFKQEKIDLKHGILMGTDGFYSLMERKRKLYFPILQFKKPKNIINAIERLQRGINNDDSTYIIIKKNGI